MRAQYRTIKGYHKIRTAVLPRLSRVTLHDRTFAPFNDGNNESYYMYEGTAINVELKNVNFWVMVQFMPKRRSVYVFDLMENSDRPKMKEHIPFKSFVKRQREYLKFAFELPARGRHDIHITCAYSAIEDGLDFEDCPMFVAPEQ